MQLPTQTLLLAPRRCWQGRGCSLAGSLLLSLLWSSQPAEMCSLLPLLLSPDPGQAVPAIQGLLGDLQLDKESTLEAFLGDAKCEEYLWALCKLLAVPDVR